MSGHNRLPLQGLFDRALNTLRGLVLPDGTEQIGTFPFSIAQSGVPVILAPSGTVATNGAITLGTALPIAYTGGAWVYLPADAVVGGLAGLYWCVFSSTTVGAVKTNFVDASSEFTPNLPSGALVAAVGSNAAYTQTTGADITLANIAVPGGVLGTNGMLRTTTFSSTNSTAGNKIIKEKFGGTTFSTETLTTSTAVRHQVDIVNCGAANINASNSSVAFGTSAAAIPILGAINTALKQTFLKTAQIAVDTDYAILSAFTLEVRPA